MSGTLPTVGNSTSPTVLLQQYLQSKGMSPNMPGYGAAMRQALEQNNREDGSIIPGLRNDVPGTDQPQAAGAVGKGGGSVAKRIEGGTPQNAINTDRAPGETEPAATPGNKTTSASPTAAATEGGSSGWDWAKMLGLPALGAAGAAIPGAARELGPMPGAGAGEMPTIGYPPEVAPRGMLDAPTPMIAQDPMQAALNRAVPGPEPMPQLGAPPPQLEAPPMQLPAPPPQLAAPQARPPIPLPDATSGAPIPMPAPQLPGQAQPVPMPEGGQIQTNPQVGPKLNVKRVPLGRTILRLP